jgi:uncharacterized protein YkwD
MSPYAPPQQCIRCPERIPARAATPAAARGIGRTAWLAALSLALAFPLFTPHRAMAADTSTTKLTLTASSSGACPMPPAEIQNGMLAAVNAQRAADGRGRLVLEPALIRAAQLHACDMAEHGFFGHTGSSGTSPMRRVKEQGYKNCIVAENLALGQTDIAQAMRSLMASPGHRTNIDRPRVQTAGFGYLPKVNGEGPWWVQVFARPC